MISGKFEVNEFAFKLTKYQQRNFVMISLKISADATSERLLLIVYRDEIWRTLL